MGEMGKCADGINVQMRKYADVQMRKCADGRLLWIDGAFEYVYLLYEIHGVVDVDIGWGGIDDTDIFQ